MQSKSYELNKYFCRTDYSRFYKGDNFIGANAAHSWIGKANYEISSDGSNKYLITFCNGNYPKKSNKNCCYILNTFCLYFEYISLFNIIPTEYLTEMDNNTG